MAEQVFEYAPETEHAADAPAAAEAYAAPPTPGIEPSPLALHRSCAAAFDATALDAAGRPLAGALGAAQQRSSYEAPRLKLARLRREAGELRAELERSPEAYDADDGATLLHDVEALRLSLERLAAGLPAEPPPPPPPDAAAAARAARAAAADALRGAAARGAAAPVPAPPAAAAAAAAGAADLAADEARLRAAPPPAAVAAVLARLLSLKGLHDASAEDAAKLKRALLEQQALHEKLKSNDAALARVAKALEDRLPAPPSSG